VSVMNLDARMAVAFVMNRPVETDDVDQRRIDIVNAAYDSLGVLSEESGSLRGHAAR